MGYRVNPKRTITLDFPEGSPHHGAVIQLRGHYPLDAFQRLRSDIAVVVDGGSAEEERAALDAIVAACIVSWNIEDEDGTPVPVSGAALTSVLGVGLARAVIAECASLLTGAARELAPEGEPTLTSEGQAVYSALNIAAPAGLACPLDPPFGGPYRRGVFNHRRTMTRTSRNEGEALRIASPCAVGALWTVRSMSCPAVLSGPVSRRCPSTRAAMIASFRRFSSRRNETSPRS